MENLNSYQFTTLSDISNLSFLFNLVCTPCTLNFRSIYVPTLVIGGTEDPISRPDLMLRTVECIPHSKLILYHGFSHNEPWKIFVEEVSSEIAFFLDNVYNNEGHYYKKIENL